MYQKLEEICKTLQVIEEAKLADANKERVHLLKMKDEVVGWYTFNLSAQRLCSRQLAFLH